MMDGPNYLFPNDNSPGRKVIGHAANQSIRPYNTNQEYLYAMREDLADWFKGLYAVEINVNNFFEILETGTLLCQHANNITTCADYMIKHNVKLNLQNINKVPKKFIVFNQGKYVRASSFFARDNIANFINWCRHEIEISESVMFETNDLVLRHNEKNVILCLLEVARRGSKFGVPAPVLVQMEEDIDKEIELEKEAKKNNRKPPNPPQQKVTCDFKSLDEMVQYILGMCTCPSQFPMVKVADGKYKVGDSESLIFMRILRQHVMVRVGGGWDTLEHYLNKHDPCRCMRHRTDKKLSPRHSRTQSTPATAVQQQQQQLSVAKPQPNVTKQPQTPRNRQLLASKRLAQSHSNLMDLSSNRSQSTVQRRSVNQPRPSSTTPRQNNRNSMSSFTPRSSEVSPTRSGRTSTQNNDVFARLSRPKSTPPIQRESRTHTNDQLMVQRNKTGTHKVKRTSDSSPKSPPSAFNGSRTERPRSTVSTPRTSRVNRSSIMKDNSPNQRNSGSARNSNTRKNSDSTASMRKSLSTPLSPSAGDRELQMLQAFEKECLSNQVSLLTVDTDSEVSQAFGSSFTSDDLEVAVHLERKNSDDLNNSATRNSNYGSLPRPRKEKRDSTERRSRIPTPVSFSRSSLNKSVDIDLHPKQADKTMDKKPQTTHKSHSLDLTQQIAPSGQNRPTRAPLTTNPLTSNSVPSISSFAHELQVRRRQMSIESIDSDTGNIPVSAFTKTSYNGSPPKSPMVNGHPKSFVHIDHDNVSSAILSTPELSPISPTYPDAYQQQSDNYKPYDQNKNILTNRSLQRASQIPEHILQTCGLTNQNFNFKNTTQNGHRVAPVRQSKSREPQWV